MRIYRRGSRYATLVALARAQDAIATIDKHGRDIPGFTDWRGDLQLARSRIDRAGAIVASGVRRWHETAAGVVSAAGITAIIAVVATTAGMPALVAVIGALPIGLYAAAAPVRLAMIAVHAYGRRCWLRVLPEPVPLVDEAPDAAALVGHLVSALVRANTELRLSRLGTSGMPGDAWWAVDRAGPLASVAWRATAGIWGRVAGGWRFTDPPATEADELPDSDEVREAARLIAAAAEHLDPLLDELSRLSTRAMVTWTGRLLMAREILWRTATRLGYEAAPVNPVTPRALVAELVTAIAAATGTAWTAWVVWSLPVAAVAGAAAAAASLAAPVAVAAVRSTERPRLIRRAQHEFGGHLGHNLGAMGRHIDMWAAEAKYLGVHVGDVATRVRANQVARVPWRTAAAEQVAAARAWITETHGAMCDYTRMGG